MFLIRKLVSFYQSVFLSPRFFVSLAAIILVFVLAFFLPVLFLAGKILCLILVGITLVDFALLFSKNGIWAQRQLPIKLSNADQNPIFVNLKNNYPFSTHLQIVEELPSQFQKRDFLIQLSLKKDQNRQVEYILIPNQRGEYHFGKLYVFAQSPLGIIQKRYGFEKDEMVKTYPSFLALKNFDFLSIQSQNKINPTKKIRKIGHSFEFEQIKEYIEGDNIKDINWKASAKKNELMVNHFQEETSQNVYCVIDSGRNMKMPFKNLSLLEYAINSTLLFSHVALGKKDKTGLYTFSKSIGNYVSAQNRNNQMNLILDSLYNIETNYSESDFGVLYAQTKRHLTQRSLIFLYTNFQSKEGLQRQLKYLKALSKLHLLVVVFFENPLLEELASETQKGLDDVYNKIIAQKYMADQRVIANTLTQMGIQNVLTSPEKLTVGVINKYLEIRARNI
ncbi:MAG: DUF58 domain-containing protein [Flavobacteriaceae bacterium]|nr:MAG: DUF58 domain-containing protein [Flavobacteriaceae bacterium]